MTASAPVPSGGTTPSLGRRLSTWLALQGFIASVVVSATVFAGNAWLLSGRQEIELHLKQGVVRHALAETATAADLVELRHKLDDFLAGHRDMSLRITSEPGTVIYEHTPQEASARWRRFQTTEWQESWPAGEGGVVMVRLSLDVSHDDTLLRRLGITLLLASLAGAAVVSVTGYLLVRRGLRPVRQLATQIEAIALDRPQQLDGAQQPPELAPLIERFNALLSRVEHAYAQLEAFNADVAHELKTPLTTLIGASELALHRERSADELRDVIAGNLVDLRRLAIIVNDMLFLSKADRGAAARRCDVPSLATALAEIVDFHEAAMQECKLTALIEGDAAGAFDLSLVRRALSNLLSNATRFATPGSVIRVRIESTNGWVRLLVQNEGCTIDGDHLPRLFDRFYRVERSRKQDSSPNHGLGLAIVAAIARMHGGRPSATSSDGTTSIGFALQSTSTPT